MSHDDWAKWWHLVSIFPIIAVLIYALMFGMSRCGWMQLSRIYPAANQPVGGIKFRGRNGKIGSWMDYTGLEVIVAAEGIHVAINGGFSMFHPPLLLPWSGVQSITEERKGFFRQTTVRFADSEGRKIALFLPVTALRNVRDINKGREL